MSAGIAIGSVVGLEALFAGPISGASMNPARSLAPALVSMDFDRLLWIYLVAPVAGALAGVYACRCARTGTCCAGAPPDAAYSPDICGEQK